MNAATWTISRLALVAACIGLLTLSTAQRAGATVIQGSDPSSNATNQVLACEAMGGTATITSYRTVGGEYSSRVTCTGGMGGGWTCINFDDVTACAPTAGVPLPTWGEHDPSIGTGDEVLEVVDDVGGTPPAPVVDSPKPPAPVVDSPKPPADSPRVAAPNDDQDQDTNTSKGKKGKNDKKGKKSGKGRKK